MNKNFYQFIFLLSFEKRRAGKSFPWNLTRLVNSLIILCFAALPAFSQQQKDDTLAVVGSAVISKKEFALRYNEKLAKIGFTDNTEFRYKYLVNLINDELLITEARYRGIDKNTSGQKELQRIRTQELLNAYSLKQISPSININDTDLKELYLNLNTRLKVSHLYAPEKEKADILYKRLQSGEKFEELAKECFSDPRLRTTGGALGYITIDEMDPDFEKAAYSMKVGEISKPVKTVQGYSIIRVEDVVVNPLTTESEFLKAYDKLHALARKRKFEEASKQYAKSLSSSLNIRFNEKMLSFIFNRINEYGNALFIEKPGSFSAAEMKKTVVTSASGTWNLKEVIEEMSLTTAKQQKFIRTVENLRDFITGLINRSYIVQQAVSEGLDKEDSYIKNVNFLFDTYLLSSIEDELKQQVIIPEDTVQAYYNNNTNKFYTEPVIRLSSILIDNQQKADSVKLLLSSGALFEKLAAQFSMQSITAGMGGDMGFFKKSDLENLAEPVFKLQPGQWSGPYEQERKFVFLKCTQFKPSELRPFNECAEEIKETLKTFEWYKLRDGFTEELKKKIPVIMYPEKLNTPDLLTKR